MTYFTVSKFCDTFPVPTVAPLRGNDSATPYRNRTREDNSEKKREINIFMLSCMCGFEKMVKTANVNGITGFLVICLLTQGKVKLFLWKL
jgi:hypothetical protein